MERLARYMRQKQGLEAERHVPVRSTSMNGDGHGGPGDSVDRTAIERESND